MKNAKFTFFHGYDETVWEGFVKRGLIDDSAGIRFCQSLLLPESKKLNSLAARGGKLFSLIRDNDFPWYIDRLQGGGYIEEYPYDMSLIEDIGGEFYGFQLHEWVSNLRSDYNKLKNLSESDWTEEKIKAEIFRLFPYPQLFLEAATAKEYAEDFSAPRAFEELLSNAERLFLRRSKYTGGCLLPCDSVMMATSLELRLGAQWVMPEIGAQTPGANLQIAYARGMTKAYGRTFGAYYEPWGGNPFSVCAYQRDGRNEWNIGDSGDFPFQTCGSGGGSSRSLQRRLYLYAYLAGASFIGEEWGLYNTFLDCEDFELSPYGEVKRDFLSFVKKYPAGEFYAPIAVVLPKDMQVLSNNVCSEWFGGLPFASESLLIREKHIAQNLNELMFDTVSKYGNETKTLANSDVPDAFDIIHEDCEAALGNYRYLVDFTFNPSFARGRRNVVTPHEAKRLVRDIMPCTVSGGLHWFVSATGDGWYLTVMNNDGIDKSVEKGEIALPQAARTAVIELKECSSIVRLEGAQGVTEHDGKYYVELCAGDFFFARLS